MSTPVTNGVERTNLSDLRIGDYIKWGYKDFADNKAGTLQQDTTDMTELADIPTNAGSGFFYFIKYKPGLLIADRAIQYGISPQSLNAKNYFKGSQYRVLTREEHTAIKASDFNGNMIYTAIKGPCFTEPLDMYYNGQSVSTGTIYFQNLSALTRTVYTRYSLSSIGFTSTSMNIYMVEGNPGTAYILFYPCMEYVDNSKSTNIYY